MSLTLLSNGILTTVQDLGRYGARRYGINPGGAMDTKAVRLINILLGNDENEAVLEMHYPAPQIRFDEDVIFSLGGGEFGAALNDSPVGNWRPVFARKGDVLKFAEKRSGTRCYLALKGGFATEKWLGSAATNLKARMGGYQGRALKKDDILEYSEQETEDGSARQIPVTDHQFPFRVSFNLVPRYSAFPTVRVIPGAEYELLSEETRRGFVEQSFKIGLQSDRMGFRLAGKPLKLEKPHEFISSAVSFGTIQLLPDGQLIILMADHQTTGGYPRLAHIISEDLPLVGQLGANDGIGFHVVDINQAEDLVLDFERELNFLKLGVNLGAPASCRQ
ncbi:MAG TPA: biotin-dependent carboxyltransferase family protein [Pyrinomonadaceae bacterium]|jgi:antagonist of KipI|nr:biotin-dependent carboxyltransferase family protein [Pyrinomonadaceae bacterium]